MRSQKNLQIDTFPINSRCLYAQYLSINMYCVLEFVRNISRPIYINYILMCVLEFLHSGYRCIPTTRPIYINYISICVLEFVHSGYRCIPTIDKTFML